MNFKAIAAAVLVACAGVANAADINWDSHAAVELGTNFAMGSGSLLNDTYSFSLAGTTSILGVAVSNDGGFFNLTDGLVELFKVGSSTAIGSFSFDSAAVNHSFGALTAGDYFYKVTGSVAAGAAAGSYMLNSQLAPVPEPETYALMLAGLAAVGFVARRRKNA